MPSLNVAHRGLHTTHPENSLEAFLAAWQAGCDMVEFDIQLSKDGVPVIFHDDDLQRMCGVDKTVFECTVLELQAFKLNGTNCCIPTFQELMNIGFGRPHYFELKIPKAKQNDRMYKEKLVDTVYHFLYKFSHMEKSYVSSFDTEVFDIIEERGYYLDNLVITFEFTQEIENYSFSRKQYEYKSFCWDYLVKQNLGLVQEPSKAFLWAIVEPEDYSLIASQGYLGIISDDPQRLLKK